MTFPFRQPHTPSGQIHSFSAQLMVIFSLGRYIRNLVLRLPSTHEYITIALIAGLRGSKVITRTPYSHAEESLETRLVHMYNEA